ncbi:MAG: hypothetical protein R2848_10365 [Thermomicrobiales bacterium]
MNRPGIAFGNWKWRYLSHQLNEDGWRAGCASLQGSGGWTAHLSARTYDPFDYSAPGATHRLFDRFDPKA